MRATGTSLSSSSAFILNSNSLCCYLGADSTEKKLLLHDRHIQSFPGKSTLGGYLILSNHL